MRLTRFVLCTAAIVAGGSACGQGFTPEEAVKRMQLPPGFTAKIVACEPMIRQPVSIEFDNRGRLWVLQYLQYPNPAGLKAVKQDEYLRTIWDRVPEPPPKGPKGADRLTICYDPDENGRFRKSKDFVTGLNLASGFCIGNGGVYVVQPPYLLFYPDKNEDDVPDGDPEVLLSGFGMEDSHAYANSLQLGPDGWLYGAQGSTVTAKIANPANPKEVIEFQQGIWRYHPKTKRFELFAEGGGNIWGLDFDKHGQMIAGTNFGGVAMMHVVQGGYYVKNWTKHGALHNPHAYGFFEHVPYTGFKGGHVTCGGIIYQGGAYPKEYEDQYIAGNLLSNAIYWHKMEPNGSTFKAHFGGDLLVSNDTWFRPVDLTLGPDGSVYVADWYDKRAAHLDPIDNWDKTNGRVYKIEYQGTKPVPPFDLRTKTSAELVELLKHPNAWWRRQARQLLGERKVSSVRRNLRPLIENETGDVALEALWVWYSLLSWDYSFPAEHNKKWIDPYPNKVSTHPNEYVRAWEIRLRGRLNDDHDYLNEKSPIVLAYTLSAMKRINEYDDNNTGNSIDTLLDKMGVVNSINLNPTAKRDTFLPLMLWWTIEPLTRKDRLSPLRVVQSIKDHGVASNLIVRNATRIVTESEPENLDLLLDFTEKSGDSWMTKSMVEGIDQGINPSSLYGRIVRHKLISVYQKYPDLPAARRVLAKIGYGPALNALLEILINSKATKNDRQQAVDALRSICSPLTLARIKEQLPNVHGDEIVIGFLKCLESYSDDDIFYIIFRQYDVWSRKVKRQAISTLLARRVWAVRLLRRVDFGDIPKTDLTLDDARTAMALNDPAVTALVEKLWGKITPATPGEKLARINSLNAALGRLGNPNMGNGKALFTQHCAACHTMHGEGGKVGPDLTTADRKNRKYMLTQIVDPSSYIRPEYVQHAITTKDGRKLVGLVPESSAEGITVLNVVDNKPVKTVVLHTQIDDVKPLPTSLMPEKLLDVLSDEQVRDLLGYLAADPPKK